MNSIKLTPFYCIAALFLIGWATKEDEGVNFSGTLIPQEGASITVENITINNKSEIMAYQKPESLPDQKTEVIFLKNNPTDMSSEFKLRKGQTLKVPSPEVEWIYQEPCASTDQEAEETMLRKCPTGKKLGTKYTEVLIDGTPYLVPKRTVIRATNKDTKVEITVHKISRLKELNITDSDIKTEQESPQPSAPAL